MIRALADLEGEGVTTPLKIQKLKKVIKQSKNRRNEKLKGKIQKVLNV